MVKQEIKLGIFIFPYAFVHMGIWLFTIPYALQSVELNELALYLDSDISPWHIEKAWEDLLPSEWVQVLVSSMALVHVAYALV